MFGKGIASFQESVDTYVKIIPTGIGVFAFENGIAEQTIGTGQFLVLDPGQYSFDFDEIYNARQLKYRYFCRIVINGLPQSYPSDTLSWSMDLKQLKKNSSTVYVTAATTCFNTTGVS